MSTTVERVFSKGCQLLSFTRNRLSPVSICYILCFGDWSRKNLIHMPDLFSAVGAKEKLRKQAFDTSSCQYNIRRHYGLYLRLLFTPLDSWTFSILGVLPLLRVLSGTIFLAHVVSLLI
jgi:hypothetical protein